MDLLLILLRILFPLRPVLQVWEVTRVYLASTLEWARDAEGLEHDQDLLAEFESYIAYGEEAVHLLIQARAREIAGLPLDVFRRIAILPPRRRMRCADAVMRRFERLAAFYLDVERLAQRRAARLRAERDANPLGLDVDVAIIFAQLAPLTCLHHMQRKWGRWIARPYARDGAGLSVAHARGPPEFA